MKKLALFLLIALPVVTTSFAQQHLMVQSEGSKLYLVHTVSPKENWYSVGRLYNISPKEIAPFNGSTLEKALAIGERLKIPLSSVNFSQDGQKTDDETFVAVYYAVQKKDALARISARHNNVPVENLESWNHIGKVQPKAGISLIVGYLKVKPALSALAATGKDHINTTTTVTKKEEVPPVVNNTVAKEIKKPDPVIEKPAAVVKQQAKPMNIVAENKPVSTTTHPVNHLPSGYFRSEYNDGDKSINGVAGIFKSTSGWQDGKYYALLNNVPVGVIIKIIDPSTNKNIFAKVLGPLPDMKESAGLAIRISNAAANELGESEGKFTVEVRY